VAWLRCATETGDIETWAAASEERIVDPGHAEFAARTQRLAGDRVMEILVILVPLALALGGAGLVAFLWSLRSGQYDDLDGAAWRAIADDDPPPQDAPAKR